jgi:transcriptional regulator with XRE-family HTH domain
MTREAFAALIEVEAASVTRYANGDRIPRPAIMRRITKVTDGQVTANDFIAVQEPIPNVNEAPSVTAAE